MRSAGLYMILAVATLSAFGQGPAHTAGVITDTTFAGNLAGTINGTLPVRPVRFPRYPFFGGIGYGGYPIYSSPAPVYPLLPTVQQVNAPAVVMVESLPEPGPPKNAEDTVKIYSNPVKMQEPDVSVPAIRTASSKQSGGETMYLIAMKDETVATAIAYWTDGTQLKYITPDRKQKQTPTKNVDVSLTLRLNEERGITVSMAGLMK